MTQQQRANRPEVFNRSGILQQRCQWLGIIGLMFLALQITAAHGAYRCEVGKSITYSDQPCAQGTQRDVTLDPANPTDADKTAALRRAAEDKKQLRKIEADQNKDQEKRVRLATATQKRNQAQAQQCSKLELKVQRLREDVRDANYKTAGKKQTQLKRAEEDAATMCSKP